MTTDHTELDVFACPLDGVNLIEASAGTGKTWNICGLYLRLLLERELTVDQILVVTFTNAATAELSARIRERLVAVLAAVEGRLPPGADPFVDRLLATLPGQPDLAARLKAALHGFDEAAIFTIHGYCQRALADTPFAAGLPFALELVTDDAHLRREVAQDFWRREVAGGALHPAVAASLGACGDCPERWAALLARTLAKPLAQVVWPEAAEEPGLEARLAALEAAYAAAGTTWEGAEAALTAGMSALHKGSYKDEAVAQAAAEWRDWLACGNCLASIDLEKGKLRLFMADVIAGRVGKGKTAPAHPFFDAAQTLAEARQAADEALARARLALLRRLMETGAQEVRRKKRAARQIAFDDMLYNLYEALTLLPLQGGGREGDGVKEGSSTHPHPSPGVSALAATLRQRFPAALIDEFQDTDPLQFDIFRRIYVDQPATLFLVGDPKQAIYSFRNADLPTYLAAKALAEHRYTLNHNQRSTPELIAACNALFGAHPAVFAQPGLDYLAVSAGAKPRPAFIDDSEPPGGAALRVWRLPCGERLSRSEAQARAETATAAEIARLIAAGRAGRITVGARPLAAGDIAVLVRSHRQAGRIKRALARLGVGSVELAQESIFESREAEDLERVLSAVAEPGRTGLLFAALATELLGRDAPALARLAEDEAALLPLLARYAGYRDTWLARGFGLLFRQWLEGEGVGPRLLVRPDGERRLTNLLHLAELLQRASVDHPGPEALLRWLGDQRRDPSVADETQLRLESDQNLVQIVTIHRAKGLEYDIVFCPYLWDGHQRSDANGEGLDYHDAHGQPVLDFRPEACGDADIKAGRRAERDAETLRQFYVALTRAVHRCYLVAGCYLTRNGRGISPKQGTRSLLNWMAAGALLPRLAEASASASPDSSLSPRGAGGVSGSMLPAAEVARQCNTAPGARSGPAVRAGLGLADWWEHELPPEAIEAAWARLAADAAPHLALLDLPETAGQPLAPDQPDPARLRALPPPRAMPAGWRIGSFSALAAASPAPGVAEREESRFADAEASANPAPRPRDPLPETLPADDILRFPRGPAAGDCLHAAFEAAEFTDPANWDGAIARALAAHPQRLDGLPPAEATPRLAAMLRRGLADVLATELPEGIRLDRIAAGRRQAELGFHLPVGRLTPAALADCLAAHGLHLPALHFPALEGYLKGYIDLAFEHGGRYYVLDWKSNHLGHRPEDYGPGPLAAAMEEHAYGLQALIYSLALHRHLARRLPGYDPAQHFGGALYLFVRGVRPGWRVDGAAAGVFFQPVSPELLADLDALFGADGATGREPAAPKRSRPEAAPT